MSMDRMNDSVPEGGGLTFGQLAQLLSFRHNYAESLGMSKLEARECLCTYNELRSEKRRSRDAQRVKHKQPVTKKQQVAKQRCVVDVKLIPMGMVIPVFRKKGDRKEWYHTVYLHSEHWQSKRQVALEYAERRCQMCYVAGHLQVHHRTYERLGDERPSDLIVLCSRCHHLHHESLATI